MTKQKSDSYGDKEMEALQEVWSESVSRTNRFIVLSLTVLTILVVVVEQQVREYDKRIRH